MKSRNVKFLPAAVLVAAAVLVTTAATLHGSPATRRLPSPPTSNSGTRERRQLRETAFEFRAQRGAGERECEVRGPLLTLTSASPRWPRARQREHFGEHLARRSAPAGAVLRYETLGPMPRRQAADILAQKLVMVSGRKTRTRSPVTFRTLASEWETAGLPM